MVLLSEVSCHVGCGGWNLNLAPLKEPSLLLPAEPSLWTLSPFFLGPLSFVFLSSGKTHVDVWDHLKRNEMGSL